MTTDTQTIGNLMKVSLSMKTGEKAQAIPFEFVYGIGTEGITPFEKALFGKTIGAEVRFDLSPGAFCSTMGHLQLPFLNQTGILEPVSLQVTVDRIAKATDQEVVKAIAAGGSCNDCGCGCGNH